MIKAESLSKQFDKRGIAGIHQLSFTLEGGKVLAIMGPNGSGKTTLLKILSGKVQADGGNFSVDGKISFFPQSEDLPDMNVQKFLIQSITLDIDDEKKIQLARDLANTFEFTFQLRQNLKELSSGQRQKVLLSRELINRPALLLMDEPFTHLDPFTRKDILNGLFDYIHHQGTTVLWVTHDLDEAFRLSDQIALMNFGNFEQMGDPVTLIQKPKNLFVAEFLGYRNFFPVKFENSSWSSPWGKLDFPRTEKDDAILVIPDFAWEKNDDGLGFIVQKSYAAKQGLEYVLEFANQRVYYTTSPNEVVILTGGRVHLSPLLKHCFLIPL